jgi:nicotinamide riboside transporter PnuC
MTLQYEILRDTVVVLIHVYFFALTIYLWKVWQSRGQKKSTELATSTYGRPLVKKA